MLEPLSDRHSLLGTNAILESLLRCATHTNRYVEGVGDRFEQVVLLHPCTFSQCCIIVFAQRAPYTMDAAMSFSCGAQKLSCLQSLGGNAVRLYHSLGLPGLPPSYTYCNCTSFSHLQRPNCWTDDCSCIWPLFLVYSIHSCFLGNEAPRLFQSIC